MEAAAEIRLTKEGRTGAVVFFTDEDMENVDRHKKYICIIEDRDGNVIYGDSQLYDGNDDLEYYGTRSDVDSFDEEGDDEEEEKDSSSSSSGKDGTSSSSSTGSSSSRIIN